ncbi:MAG: FAD-binding oxidoreductase [Dehalococcoidia bacterium]|nr:MAG: FAD-binding oxidoreductase [Dehalococcoidia bacterium]
MSDAVVAPDIASFIASVRAKSPSIQIQIDDLQTYAVDDVAPAVLIRIASSDAVRIVLAEAGAAGAAVVPWGGGQHVGLANAPARYDVALSLAAMDRIVAHEPADMTVTVEPGARLAELQRRLAEHGQFLPLDPACGDAATIGGVLAANANGPLRHAFGTGRDWLIGLRIVDADGGASKSGGRVVKNVAGYDMHKLHVGAHGTLGVIVEATFKLVPLPAIRRTLAVSCESSRSACEIALAARDAGITLQRLEALSPSAASSIADTSSWTLLAETAGGAAAVDRSERDLRAIAARHGAASITTTGDAAWQRWRDALPPRELSLRATVLPSQVADAIRAIDESTSAPVQLSATVAAGVVRARIDGTDDDDAVALIERLRRELPAGAALGVESASPAAKRRIDVFGATRDDFAIMRRLKEQFDPRGTLSPGRFLGRL